MIKKEWRKRKKAEELKRRNLLLIAEEFKDLREMLYVGSSSEIK